MGKFSILELLGKGKGGEQIMEDSISSVIGKCGTLVNHLGGPYPGFVGKRVRVVKDIGDLKWKVQLLPDQGLSEKTILVSTCNVQLDN